MIWVFAFWSLKSFFDLRSVPSCKLAVQFTCEIILLHIQFVVVVMDMAVSLDQFGNISLFMVHGRGPIPGANPMMYTTNPRTAIQEYCVSQTFEILSPGVVIRQLSM